MTAANLQRIAIAHRWTPLKWHLQLAEHIPPNAVLNIFRYAQVRQEDGAFEFSDRQLAAAAEKWRRGLESAFGKGVDIVLAAELQPPPVKTGRPLVHIRTT
jgi:hypothetical protein